MRHDQTHKKDVVVKFDEKDIQQIISIPDFLDQWEYVKVHKMYQKEVGLLDLDKCRIRFVQD